MALHRQNQMAVCRVGRAIFVNDLPLTVLVLRGPKSRTSQAQTPPHQPLHPLLQHPHLQRAAVRLWKNRVEEAVRRLTWTVAAKMQLQPKTKLKT